MGSKFIAVVGNAETTRNNVEALIADFFYDRPKDYVLLLPFIDRPSQGQVWAHQIFQELGMSTAGIAPESAIAINLGGVSITHSNNPTAALIEAINGEEAHIFLLVDEDNQIDLEAFQTAQAPCYNLCMGLMPIGAFKAQPKPAEAPAIAIPTLLPRPTDVGAAVAQLLSEFSEALYDILREHGVGK